MVMDSLIERVSGRKRTSANLSEFHEILSDITYAIQDQRVVDLISEICEINQSSQTRTCMLVAYQ